MLDHYWTVDSMSFACGNINSHKKIGFQPYKKEQKYVIWIRDGALVHTESQPQGRALHETRGNKDKKQQGWPYLQKDGDQLCNDRTIAMGFKCDEVDWLDFISHFSVTRLHYVLSLLGITLNCGNRDYVFSKFYIVHTVRLPGIIFFV